MNGEKRRYLCCEHCVGDPRHNVEADQHEGPCGAGGPHCEASVRIVKEGDPS